MPILGETEAHKPRQQHTLLANMAARLPFSLHFGAISALGVRLGAAALAYLLQIVLARSLGADDYGTFSFAWSVITIGGFLATFGFGQIGVRFLAQYHENSASALAHGFLRAGLAATLCGALIACLLIVMLFPFVEHHYGALCETILAIGLIALPFFALTDLMEGLARSQGWTIRALLPPYILRQGGIILILLGAMLVGHRIGTEFAMKAALIATIFAALAHSALILPPLLRLFPREKPAYDWPTWREAARPTLLSDIALLARQNLDLILLGLLANAYAVGIYFAATRIASLLGLIEFAVGAAFGHRFARLAHEAGLAHKEGGTALRQTFAEARRLTFIPGLIGTGVLMLATPLILSLFGPEFRTAIPMTLLLLAAGGVRLLFGPLEDALTMSGHPPAVWRANAVGALVMTILCLLLCRDYTALGAAIAAASGSVATLIMLVLAARNHLGLLARKAGGTP